MDEIEFIEPGHRTCAGCGEIIGLRMLMRTLGKNTIVCHATGCMEVTTTPFPYTSWKVPWVHLTFENVAALATGVAAALKRQKKDATVVAIGGDGSLFDIGMGCLSGALERKDNILFIVTDNEGYMNTGGQKSGSTPEFSWTTTTPAGKKGKKKNILEICLAHDVGYVASASIAFPEDFQNKIKKAMQRKGPRVIHLHCPCPTGWKFKSCETIDVAKLAVQTGFWKLYEIEDGKKTITYKGKTDVPVEKYLECQRRFSKVGPKELEKIKENIKE